MIASIISSKVGRFMRNQAIATILGLAIGGCAARISPPQAPALPRGPQYETSCFDDEFDGFGRQIAAAHCRVRVTEYAPSGTYKLTPIGEQIAKIDRNGAVIGAESYRVYGCPIKHYLMISVDRKRIDLLPLEKQVSAMRGGTDLYFETPNGYPYCNTRTYEAGLAGFGTAYDEMIRRWNARGKK